MNINDIAEMEDVRRIAAQYPGSWRRVGHFLHDGEGMYLGQMIEPRLADFIIRLHNLFLPMVKLVMQQRKKLLDRSKKCPM